MNLLDSLAPPHQAWRCIVQLLNEASDPLIGAAVLQLIEQFEAHKVEVAEAVEVGDADARIYHGCSADFTLHDEIGILGDVKYSHR